METNEPKEVAVPITSSWWKMKCTLEEDDGKYVFRFHEPQKEYQPGYDTLEAALSLKLDENKPSPEVVKFINDFGTLHRHHEYKVAAARISSTRLELSRIRSEMRDPSSYLARAWEELDEEGREMVMNELRHSEACALSLLAERNKQLLAEGPFERWSTIYRDLRALQLIYLEWKATGDMQGLAEPLKRLQPRLVKREGSFVWEFGFPTLFDALVGRLAQSIVEGRSWKTCPNPKCRKVFINGKRKYCDDECREAYHNSRKSDTVGKERQRLYQTLRRRRENDLIDDATFEKVRRQINEAPTVDDLRDVERKNSKLYARLKPGPTLNGGPRQCKY